jgi:hypothetical protein
MKQEITLPFEVYDGRFTPEEIGVLGIFMTYPNQDKSILDIWDKDDKFNSVLRKMIDAKIIVFEDNKATINISKYKPSNNMSVRKNIQKLVNTYDIPDNMLIDIQDMMEEIANETYWKGYEDGKTDYVEEGTFTGYGNREDW